MRSRLSSPGERSEALRSRVRHDAVRSGQCGGATCATTWSSICFVVTVSAAAVSGVTAPEAPIPTFDMVAILEANRFAHGCTTRMLPSGVRSELELFANEMRVKRNDE